MAIEVRPFQVTIPAGTLQTALFRQDMAFPVRKVDTLEIVVPPGPSGLMGFAVTMGGVNVLPTVPGTFIVTDDEKIRWPLTGLPDSGAWQLSGYNTDLFDHSVYVRWLVDLVSTPGSQSPLRNIDINLLSSIQGG